MRMSISLMGRPDLHKMSDSRDLDALNREFSIDTWQQETMGDVFNEKVTVDFKTKMFSERVVNLEKMLPGVLHLIFQA